MSMETMDEYIAWLDEIFWTNLPVVYNSVRGPELLLLEKMHQMHDHSENFQKSKS